MYDRRAFLGAGVAGAVFAALSPRLAFAKAETDKRFVFIIQRGAADGLGIVAPVGDPAFAGARGDLALDFASAPKLDALFALHPAMARVQASSLTLGISSDLLYPNYQQRQIDEVLRSEGRDSRYVEIDSPHGHDAFLINLDQVGEPIAEFLTRAG